MTQYQACANLTHVARSSTFPIYDRAFSGGLRPMLLRWRSEGLSFNEIAFRLRSEFDMSVSPETLRRWVREIEAKGA